MSEIRANTVSDAAGTGPATLTGQYAAKAWVNFNGTSTVAIRESGNVTSITDNGTGNYTVNFTTAMTDANYTAVGGIGSSTGSVQGGGRIGGDEFGFSYTSTEVRVGTVNFNSTAGIDPTHVNIAIFR